MWQKTIEAGRAPNVSNKGLVGGFDTSEKYEFVSWDDDIPNTMGKS